MASESRPRRNYVLWIGSALLALAIAAAAILVRTRSAPGAIARDYVEQLLLEQAPSGAATTPPLDVSTTVALDFLRARVRQGASPRIDVLPPQDTPQGAAVRLVITEANEAVALPTQMTVKLVKDDSGWRVEGLSVNE